MSENYEVGYGKPPKKSQWQKGQSGNPLGKKKKKKVSDPVPESVAEVLSDTIPVQINGKKKMIPMGKALANSMVRNALQAPLKEQVAFLEKLKNVGVFEAQKLKLSDVEGDDEVVLTPAQIALIEATNYYLNKEVSEDDTESGPSAAHRNATIGADDKGIEDDEVDEYNELDLEHGMLSQKDISGHS